MPTPSTKEIVEKADIAVSDLSSGGKLNAEQFSKFVQMVQDESTILKDARTVRMNAPQMNIDKIGFASRILRPAPAAGISLDSTDRVKPTTSQVQLSTKEIMCEVNIPYDVLEDNIERGGMENTIMQQMAKRAAIDLEELFVKGDTMSGADAYLKYMDGVLKLATVHVVDNASAGVTKAVFKAATKTMPSKYMRNPAGMRFYVSYNNETDYRDTLADRQTATGDALVEGFRPVYAYGVPVRPCASLTNAYGLLTDPSNLIWGVQRDISIETDRDIRSRVLVIVMTMRVALNIEETDAVVKIINLAA